jgi:hypothetical protein
VRRYNPPPNFAKETDSRYTAYVEQFTEIFAINLSLSGPSDPIRALARESRATPVNVAIRDSPSRGSWGCKVGGGEG